MSSRHLITGVGTIFKWKASRQSGTSGRASFSTSFPLTPALKQILLVNVYAS